MSKNKASAIIFNGANKPLTEKTFSIPEKINHDEAIVKISLATICGSDVHTWLGHRPFPTPSILGHEMVGKIVKLGKNLKSDFNGKKLLYGKKDWNNPPFIAIGDKGFDIKALVKHLLK